MVLSSIGLEAQMVLPGLNRISDEHGNGHGADATRNGADGRYDILDSLKVGIPTNSVLTTIDANVNHAGAFFNHLWSKHFGAPHREEEKIGIAAMLGKILTAGVADGNCRIAGWAWLGKHQGKRFPDDIGATDNYGALSGA